LSTAATVLSAGAAAAGLLRRGLYHDEPSVAAVLRAYDAVTLSAAVPSLAMWHGALKSSSPNGQMLQGAFLAYLVYAYATFVFGTALNALFLVHLAVLILSITALALLLADLDPTEAADRLSARTPTRWISALLGFLGGSLGAMWSFYSVRYALTGKRPAESKLVQPMSGVRLAYALDFLLVVPEYLTAAVLLWRRAPWGYVLATLLLASGALLQVQYMAALLFQSAARVPGATPFDPAEPVIALAMAGGAAALLVGLRRRPTTLGLEPAGQGA
jgi:hypothetical protein